MLKCEYEKIWEYARCKIIKARREENALRKKKNLKKEWMKRIYKKMKDKKFVQNLIPVCQLVSWREERKKGGGVVFRTVYRDNSKVRICINLLHTGGTLKLWNRQMFIPSGWKDIDVLKFEIVAIRLISFDQNLHNSAPYDNNGHHAKLVECSRGSDEFRCLKSYDRIYIKSTN